jgi:hypothetical protein
MCSQASAARSSGKTSVIARTPLRSALKRSGKTAALHLIPRQEPLGLDRELVLREAINAALYENNLSIFVVTAWERVADGELSHR